MIGWKMMLYNSYMMHWKKENADISIGRYNSYDETRYVYMTYVTDLDDSLEVIEGKAIMDRGVSKKSEMGTGL